MVSPPTDPSYPSTNPAVHGLVSPLLLTFVQEYFSVYFKAYTSDAGDAIAYSGQRAGLVITRSWVRASLAPGCRVAAMGQLLFAPWAWAYSTLHP